MLAPPIFGGSFPATLGRRLPLHGDDNRVVSQKRHGSDSIRFQPNGSDSNDDASATRPKFVRSVGGDAILKAFVHRSAARAPGDGKRS